MEKTDDQEVVRTIGDLKKYASMNWWSGFGSGVIAIVITLFFVFYIGLKYNIWLTTLLF